MITERRQDVSAGMALSARDLASKWGFNDGDMPDELWDLLDLIDERMEVDWHAVLRRVVRARLLPLLSPEVALTVYDIETCHNPIRTDYWCDDGFPPNILVVVLWDELVAECQGFGA